MIGVCAGASASVLAIQLISLLSESPQVLISGLLSQSLPSGGDPSGRFLNQQLSSSSPSRTGYVTNNKKTTRTSKLLPKTSLPKVPVYTSASIEEYIVQNADRLGYNSEDNPTVCQIWKNHQAVAHISGDMKGYLEELKHYT